MFDALIAALLLSLGVLGALSVQWQLLSEARHSAQRALAIHSLSDLSERMKTNPGRFAVLGAYVLPDWHTPSANLNTNALRDCRSASCWPEQQAAWDLQEWLSHLSAAIPGVQAISFLAHEGSDAAHLRQLGVMLAWSLEGRLGATDASAASVFQVTASVGAAEIRCPEQMACQLAYLQP